MHFLARGASKSAIVTSSHLRHSLPQHILRAQWATIRPLLSPARLPSVVPQLRSAALPPATGSQTGSDWMLPSRPCRTAASSVNHQRDPFKAFLSSPGPRLPTLHPLHPPLHPPRPSRPCHTPAFHPRSACTLHHGTPALPLVLPSSHHAPLHPFAAPKPYTRTPQPPSALFRRRYQPTLAGLGNTPLDTSPPGKDPSISPQEPSDPSQLTTQITNEAKAAPGEQHAAVKAHQDGRLGFGFSAGGLLFGYFAGVCHALKEHDILRPGMPIAGSSAGSLVAAAVSCGLPDEAVLECTLRMSRDCRENGTRYRLAEVLRTSLQELLPEDAHLRCTGNTFVSVTQVVPFLKGVVISEFTSRDELISALVTSCHIPWYFDGKWMARFRGGFFMDGAVLNPLPSPPGVDYTCKVCCFPSKMVNTYLSGLDIAIAPDVMEEFSYAMVDYLGWAVLPAEESAIVDLYEKGRRDGTAWARSVGLLGGKHAPVPPPKEQEASSAA